MCSKIRTTNYTSNDSLELAGRWLAEAEILILGAGAGLSAAGGLLYTGERFLQYFGDFAQAYPIDNMYAGGFFPFPTEEELWGWWCRHIYYNRYLPPALEPHRLLREMVGGKDYFVLTTNVDHQFQKAGFDGERLFYTQGDYGRFQCSVPCRQETFSNEARVKDMMDQQVGRKIPTALLPSCPHCGKPLTLHLRKDGAFVQDDHWHQAQDRYGKFLDQAEKSGKKVLFLELGVGFNTPGIIKYPFWQRCHQGEQTRLLSLNLEQPQQPKELEGKALFLEGDILELLRKLQ